MIRNKKELRFYIQADTMMMKGVFKLSPLAWIVEKIYPNYELRYLKCYRKVQYYEEHLSGFNKLYYAYWRVRKRRLGAKLGFHIGGDYGYGLMVPHCGTVIAGGTVGNYAVLHSCVCITGAVRKIGDGLYMSTGAKIAGEVKLGNNVTVAPNAVVSKSRKGDNILLNGMPADIERENYPTWYERDGKRFVERKEKVEKLKKELGL